MCQPTLYLYELRDTLGNKYSLLMRGIKVESIKSTMSVQQSLLWIMAKSQTLLNLSCMLPWLDSEP